MKKIFTILVALLLTASVFAQSPEKMSYQAVIRNSSDVLVTDTQVGMQISILQDTEDGSPVYVETQTPTTNANGLVSVEIGDGTVLNGDFSSIDWSNGPYFIKTETDPTGGTSYTITGTSQLLSVPYALHAKTAETVAESDPLFTSWDKTTGISITESQISDLGTFIETETDPLFTAWDKSTGITITESQISDLNHFQTSDETDPTVPSGTQTGEMQYWNGTEWITVAAGNEGQMLSFVGGVPTWTTVVGIKTVGSTDVYNPTTGEIWMDRNLGASQVATSSTDADAYGDLYQWGRAADGHELRTSTTTSTNATTAVPNGGNAWDGLFITEGSTPYDWLTPQDDNLWQGVSGTNNPCPSGYRLPTAAEWEAERQSWGSNNSAGAFASPLKLPMAGLRNVSNGSLGIVGSYGLYWSSTVGGTGSRHLYFYSSSAGMGSDARVYGFSMRCLKDD